MTAARCSGIVVGALGAAVGYQTCEAVCAGSRRRVNYRGRLVTMAAGPAVVLGSVLGVAVACPPGGARTAAASATAVLAAGAVGAYDDRVGTPAARGLAGHLGALRHGRVTTGSVKVAGIGTGALLAARILHPAAEHAPAGPGGCRAELLVRAGLIAGSANMLNLLDLRPGRAGKAALLGALPVLAGRRGWAAAGPAGAAAALLPADLGERTMLGDTGANALGAGLGVAVAATARRGTQLAVLAVLVGLTALSERLSFSGVIDVTPPLRWVDALGRLP